MIDAFLDFEHWVTFCAAFCGALWGVSLQLDFKDISIRAKAWRVFLGFIAAMCIGPGLLHWKFRDAALPMATGVMFATGLCALFILPVLTRRIQLLAKTGKLWGLPEDTK